MDNNYIPLLASLVSLSVSTNIFMSSKSRICLLQSTRIPSNNMTSAGYTTLYSGSLWTQISQLQIQQHHCYEEMRIEGCQNSFNQFNLPFDVFDFHFRSNGTERGSNQTRSKNNVAIFYTPWKIPRITFQQKSLAIRNPRGFIFKCSCFVLIYTTWTPPAILTYYLASLSH